MESIRQQKVARQLQKDIGEIIQQSGSSVTRGAMITVTVVRISPDLSYAKVYVSIFPPNSRDEVLQNLRNRAGEVRGKLGARVKNQLRIVPELAFHIDDSLDYAERIDELLK